MSELGDAKTLGGVGAVLSTFGVLIPRMGFIISIAGFVLEAVAVYKISKMLNDGAIFTNYLISIALAIAGLFIAVFLGVATIITSIVARNFAGIFLSIIVILLVLCVALIISALFLKKSFDSIARKLNVSLFSTAALIYLIGAATAIIVIGLIIIFVADIIKIIAFFSIPETVPQPSPPPPPQGYA